MTRFHSCALDSPKSIPTVGDLRRQIAGKIIDAYATLVGAAGRNLWCFPNSRSAAIRHVICFSSRAVRPRCLRFPGRDRRRRGRRAGSSSARWRPNPDRPRADPCFQFAAAYLPSRAKSRRRSARKCLLPTYDVFDEDRYFEARKLEPTGASSNTPASGSVSRSARTSGPIRMISTRRLYQWSRCRLEQLSDEEMRPDDQPVREPVVHLQQGGAPAERLVVADSAARRLGCPGRVRELRSEATTN